MPVAAEPAGLHIPSTRVGTNASGQSWRSTTCTHSCVAPGIEHRDSGGEIDVCELATMFGAIDWGFRVILVTDALCGSADETHDAMMNVYTNRFGSRSRPSRRKPSLKAGRARISATCHECRPLRISCKSSWRRNRPRAAHISRRPPFPAEKPVNCVRAQIALMPYIAKQHCAVAPAQDKRGTVRRRR